MSMWSDFMKGRMGPYMKKHGSHGKAIRALSKDFKKAQDKCMNETTVTAFKKCVINFKKKKVKLIKKRKKRR